MAHVVARSRAGDAHANDARGTETRWTVAALPVLATPSITALRLSTLSTSEPNECRISVDASDGIGHHGGRPRRVLTSLLVCGLCAVHLRASPRTRHETQWRPVRGSKLNESYAHHYSQPRYVCPLGHLAIIAEPLERLIEAARTADRPAETLAGAII